MYVSQSGGQTDTAYRPEQPLAVRPLCFLATVRVGRELSKCNVALATPWEAICGWSARKPLPVVLGRFPVPRRLCDTQ